MEGALEVSRSSDQLVSTLGLGAAAAIVLTVDHGATPFEAEFAAAAAASGIPATLLKAHARVESGFRSISSPANPNGTRDLGVMQINQATAQALGLDLSRLVSDPGYCILEAARFMVAIGRELGSQADVFHRIAAYNAGTPAILRRGIFNVAYTASVFWHYQLYELAHLLGGK